MPDELFNPAGSAGEPLGSLEDAVEATACIGLALWLSDNRPSILAVEIDGQGGAMWFVNVLELDADEPSMRSVEEGEDAQLWSRALESWELLLSVGRATRHLISTDEANHWKRGWP